MVALTEGWKIRIFMKRVLIFLICLIGYQIGCHAQMADEHYYFKNLSVQNGLSQNTVNAILQDRQGFMWFGTKDGLNRYDGLSFRKFKHDDRTQRSIGNNLLQLYMRMRKEISG